MNGRSNVSILALVSLLSAALAGCVDAPSFLTESDAEATARENRDLADNAALAWNPEAVLVGVAAFEASAAHAKESGGILPPDPTVGNGRALLWFYAYQTPGGDESRLFRVDADGRIQVENTSMVPMDQVGKVEPVASWTVDSDAAMGAAQTDPTFLAAVGAENASVVSAVGSHEGAAKWALVAVTEAHAVAALVDATTGELLLVETIEADDVDLPAMPGVPGHGISAPVHMEGSGSVGGRGSAEFPFSYLGTGDDGMLEIHLSTRLPTDGLRWAILDSDGEAVHEGYLGGGPASRNEVDTYFFGISAPGDYTLVFTHAGIPLPLSEVDFRFILDVGPAASERADREE